jgi:hypothetical protein
MTPNDLTLQLAYSASIASLLILTTVASAAVYASHFEKRAQHTSRLSGEQWVQELLNGHEDRLYNELGMHKHVFLQLLAVLRQDAGVEATRYVSAEEQLAIFLHYTRRSLSNRALQERFQRSGDTISKCVIESDQRTPVLIVVMRA